MKTIYINLHTTNEAQKFVEDVSLMEGDFDLCSGRFTVDAKSLKDVLNLGLSSPLKLMVPEGTELKIFEKYKQH